MKVSQRPVATGAAFFAFTIALEYGKGYHFFLMQFSFHPTTRLARLLLSSISYCGRLLLTATIVSPLLAAQTLQYTINPTERYQTIANFGASDCWTTQFAGKLPDAKRNQLADWLFSTKLDEQGNLKGIGLTLWRFNIGTGSSEQGKNSQIRNPMRRSECFLQPDGSYDWSRQAGQCWFLQAARERGVDQFLAFCNSAPVYMTKPAFSRSQTMTR